MKNTVRDIYMDNLRTILIVMVVLGHFLSKMSYCPHYKNLSYFLYLFHMPCFVYVSGYFAKSSGNDPKKLASKAGSLFWLFLLFQSVLSLLNYAYTGKGLSTFLRVSTAPWYLLALSVWYLLTPVLNQFRPVLMIGLSFLLSIAAGFDPGIASTFSLSRIVVFFPFFAIGYYMNESFRNKLYHKHFVLPAAILFFGAMGTVIMKGQQLKPYMTIVYGASSYHDLDPDALWRGALLRVLWYLLALSLSICLMYLIPRKKNLFSYIGQRTLSIYILHILIRYIMQQKGYFVWLKHSGQLEKLTVFAVAGIIVLVCSLSVFHRAMIWLSKLWQPKRFLKK